MDTVERTTLQSRLTSIAVGIGAGVALFLIFGPVVAAMVALAALVAGILLQVGARLAAPSEPGIAGALTPPSLLLPLGVWAATAVLVLWGAQSCHLSGWGVWVWTGVASLAVVGGAIFALFALLPALMPAALRRAIKRAQEAAIESKEASKLEEPGLDYDHPSSFCDVVMKGGITSGVIYPLAVCELATVYRLKNIGGASAGAIAATAAAAAEYGRDAGGFRKLEGLPAWLAGGSHLIDLFQPQPRTKPLFRLLIAGIGHSPAPIRFGKVFARLLFSSAFFAMALGAAPGAYLLWRGVGATGCAPAVWLAGVPLALVGVVLGTLGWLLIQARNIPQNRFGLCSGFGPEGSEKPALTNWLTGELEDLAGRVAGASTDVPLTFGHLWLNRERDVGSDSDAKELRAAKQDPEKRSINLEMMTTNLTQHRPYRFPLVGEDEEWFFDPKEFRDFFPEHIVTWLEDHPAKTGDLEQLLIRKLLHPLRPLPAAADIPVVLGARFSLSFPMLLSAVPLYQPDWGRTQSQEAKEGWSAWLGQHEDMKARLKGDLDWTPDAIAEWDEELARSRDEGRSLVPERSWFSDGGISSNFPVHFFDSLIPRWPTFAINLRDFHPDHPRDPMDERKNIFMPTDPRGGVLETISQLPEKGAIGPLGAFFSALVNTARNWHDTVLMRVPGYRDRVVHVSHTKEEGGMNLNMPTDVITALTTRGRRAGERLRVRFTEHPATWDLAQAGYEPATFDADKALGWDFQRWVRLRMAVGKLEESLDTFEQSFDSPQPPYQTPHEPPGPLSYQDLVAREEDAFPYWYDLDPAQRTRLQDVFARLGALVEAWNAPPAGASSLEGGPASKTELRITPKI